MAGTPSEVTIVDACMVEDDFVYMSTRLDALDPDEDALSRMSFFDGRTGGKWMYHDLMGWRVVSVCVIPASATSPRLACALTEQGKVELYGRDGSSIETIPDAGLEEPSTPAYGYLNRLRFIGSHLYACGVGGQIYKRRGPDNWVHFDAGVLQSVAARNAALQRLQSGEGGSELLADLPRTLDLADIAGVTEHDMYVVGSHGSVFHLQAGRWNQIAIPTDDDLTSVHCVDSHEVWLCGANGYVLTGNAQQGFRNVSSPHDNQTFRSVVKFRGVVYLANDRGLFVYDGQAIAPLVTSLVPDAVDANVLLATQNALWSVGFKDVLSFDGTRWRRIRHPDNRPI